MRNVTLGDILTPDQTTEVARILSAHSKPIDAIGDLKKYLGTIKDELLTKHKIVSDYLAYAIVAQTIKNHENN